MINNQKHFYWLDWVRFSAAFMVVAIHARGGVWVDWGKLDVSSHSIYSVLFFAVTRAGAECVLIFFVLSGFLVGGRLIDRLRNNTFDLFSYTVDRITRIWVPLLPALFWAACVAYLAGKSLSWIAFIGSLTGLQGVFTKPFAENIPLWSLAYEIWFYFLGGCLAVWISFVPQKKIVACFGIAVGFAIFTKLDTVFLFAWILGASTYWLYHENKNKSLAIVGCFMMVAGFVFSQLRTATVSVDLSGWLYLIPSSSVATLIFTLGVALVLPYLTRLIPKSRVGKKVNAVGEKFAAFSYTLYLTHYPTLYLWEHYMPGRSEFIDFTSVCWYGLRIISSMAVAWLLYLPFEGQTARVRNFINGCWINLYPHKKVLYGK